MIRAVLDTNILASGLVGLPKPDSAPGEVLRLWQAGAYVLVLSNHILRELQETLEDTYFRRRLVTKDVKAALRNLAAEASVVEIGVDVRGVATHPEDDLVLATALSGSARYVVTGDRQLLKLEEYRHPATQQSLKLLSVHAFLTLLHDRLGGPP